MIIIFPIDLWFRPKCKIKTSRYNNLTIEHLKLKSSILFAQETRDSTNLMVTFFLTSHNAIFHMRDPYLNIYRKLSIFICFWSRVNLVIIRISILIILGPKVNMHNFIMNKHQNVLKCIQTLDIFAKTFWNVYKHLI